MKTALPDCEKICDGSENCRLYRMELEEDLTNYTDLRDLKTCDLDELMYKTAMAKGYEKFLESKMHPVLVFIPVETLVKARMNHEDIETQLTEYINRR
jgi:hypothetical protein